MINKKILKHPLSILLTFCLGLNALGTERKNMNTIKETFNPEQIVQQTLAQPIPANWQKSGLTRDYYLDIVENIVRNFAGCVDEHGAVIDPVLKYEYYQSSPRFAAPCAVAIYFGRCLEYKELAYRVMDHCCEGLGREDSVNRSPDFWMRELMTAYYCLKDIAPPERVAKWRELLSKVNPEKNYKFASRDPEKRAAFHNWAIYGGAGESMRQKMNIPAPAGALWGDEFFELHLADQYWRFNEFGMYRDPGDPITYDITTRMQIEIALAFGYKGRLYDSLLPKLDRAMLVTLLISAPGGQTAFGGRSSQFYFQEAIISTLCELAARRAKAAGDLKLAGAYKRQAHLAAMAVKDGMLRKDGKLYHIKNFFPKEELHGCDPYGQYSQYSLFCGSVFALAALFSDESIAEVPAPVEIGNYSFAIHNSFRKAFATANGNHVEFELLPPKNIYDSCGLGRVILKDMPWGMLPIMPFAAEPYYLCAKNLQFAKKAFAIAPMWVKSDGKQVSLADNYTEEIVGAPENLGRYTEIAPGVAEVVYNYENCRTTYRVDLTTPGRMVLNVKLEGDAKEAFMTVPLLKNNGADKPLLELQDSSAVLTMQGKRLTVQGDAPGVELIGTAVNRTGEYSIVKFPMKNNQTTIVFTLQ